MDDGSKMDNVDSNIDDATGPLQGVLASILILQFLLPVGNMCAWDFSETFIPPDIQLNWNSVAGEFGGSKYLHYKLAAVIYSSTY